MERVWQSLQTHVDPQRHAHVSRLLALQKENAHLWQDVCVSYFGQFANPKS
jgi:alpha-glucuronidase